MKRISNIAFIIFVLSANLVSAKEFPHRQIEDKYKAWHIEFA